MLASVPCKINMRLFCQIYYTKKLNYLFHGLGPLVYCNSEFSLKLWILRYLKGLPDFRPAYHEACTYTPHVWLKQDSDLQSQWLGGPRQYKHVATVIATELNPFSS
jgi:hypothetical protein